MAFCANVAVCLTASPFRLLPEWLYGVFAIASFAAFHMHFVGKHNENSYQIFDFKKLFFRQKSNPAKYEKLLLEKPEEFY